MADQRLKELHGSGRRDFLRWATALGAVLGLERARFLDALSGSAGVAMADQAACATTSRSVHIVAGNGGLAHFQLIFPHVAVAKSNNANAGFHAIGKAIDAKGTDKPLVYAPESPFQKNKATRQISAFMGGTNETHTSTPMSAATINTGVGMIAAIAAIQQANPTLLPVIGVNPLVFGTAAGAPAVATVASAAGLVDLFNSAASKALLQQPATANLNEAYYKAFLGLNAAAGRQTMAKPYNVGKVAANLLGKNLSAQLTPSTTDQTAYGVDAGTPTAISEIANALCTAVKAFKLGLTSSLVIPAFRDDPHGLFSNGDAQAQQSAAMLGKVLDAFIADCAATPDPSCASATLADNIVMTIHGDTPKAPNNRNGWPDGTPGNSNWMYVYGNGFLKTGWHGGIDAADKVTGWDPSTGNDVPGQASATTAQAAAAAAAYAVTKGDMRRVQDFYRGTPITGVVNLQQM
jgi:hypothetical protein